MNAVDLKLLVKTIVTNQSSIIGPIAAEQANRVNGIQISEDLQTITLKGNGASILVELVKQYEKLFGKASIEVCREAVKEVIAQLSDRDLPEILK